jgi:phosphatidylserine/phosphatidylglycerophosphate/cardiolipin synthase-like enzyme
LSFGWATHRRVHFRLDSRCPLAGSHHQKIVVVDDKVAFVGGMDIASARWDTPMHLVEDSRRIDPWGRPYPPHHDVQLAVDGEAAAALGDLARERWRLATGRAVPRRQGKRDPWPRELDPDARDVDVAFARTSPEEKERRHAK